MKTNEEHYTINMQTHYTTQYRFKACAWMSNIGGIRIYLSIEDARKEIEEAFKDEDKFGPIDEATIIEWKKTPVLVKKNIKPVIKSETTFDVEVFNKSSKEWSVRRYGFETFKAAQNYIEERTPLWLNLTNQFRIVQKDVTVKTSIV